MRGQLTRLCTLVLAVVVVAIASSSDAKAELLDYRLNGGPFGRYYYVQAYVYPSWYGPVISASMGDWNATGKVSFTQTTNYSASVMDFYSSDYGATGWRGVMAPFAFDGTFLAACLGCAPADNWDYAELSLNDYYISSDRFVNDPLRTRSTAAHEFGHGIALAHTGVASDLMYPYTSRYDTYGTYTPQANDIYWADQAY